MIMIKSVFHRWIATLLLLAVPAMGVPPSYDEDDEPGDFFNGTYTSTSSEQALAASMVAWGIGLAGGIAALTLLIGSSTGEPSAKSGGGGSSSGGSSAHTHTHS